MWVSMQISESTVSRYELTLLPEHLISARFIECSALFLLIVPQTMAWAHWRLSVDFYLGLCGTCLCKVEFLTEDEVSIVTEHWVFLGDFLLEMKELFHNIPAEWSDLTSHLHTWMSMSLFVISLCCVTIAVTLTFFQGCDVANIFLPVCVYVCVWNKQVGEEATALVWSSSQPPATLKITVRTIVQQQGH